MSAGQLGTEEYLQTDPGGGLHQVGDPGPPGPGQGDPPPEHGGQEHQVSHSGQSEDPQQDIGHVVTCSDLDHNQVINIHYNAIYIKTYIVNYNL